MVDLRLSSQKVNEEPSRSSFSSPSSSQQNSSKLQAQLLRQVGVVVTVVVVTLTLLPFCLNFLFELVSLLLIIVTEKNNCDHCTIHRQCC
eukprot:m.357278 g.357278  ORF g.357278 m.357278 type:complete len:90 (+) comp17768_c0_seq1:482-751(+)